MRHECACVYGSRRPFVWAQRLAGLSGELPLSHTTRTAAPAAASDDEAGAEADARETMHTVVERLEARLRTTAALTALLTELTCTSLPCGALSSLSTDFFLCVCTCVAKRALPANLAPEAFPVPEASRCTVVSEATERDFIVRTHVLT